MGEVQLRKIFFCCLLMLAFSYFIVNVTGAKASINTSTCSTDANSLNANWNILEYETPSAIPVDELFRQGLYDANKQQYSVGINAGNLDQTKLTTVKRFKLEKGKTYKLDVNYYISMSNVNLKNTYIDFNGEERINTPTSAGGQKYSKVITPDKDETYKITLKLETFQGANVTMMLSYGKGEGLVKMPDKPTVDPVKANQDIVTGTGTPGNTILVKNINGVEIGRAIVTSDGEYSVKVNEPLIEGEILRVYQMSDDLLSEATPILVIKA